MLEEKEIEIEGKTFIISKFDAWSGREICTQYPITAAPRLGNYELNEKIVLKMMHFVQVKIGDNKIALSTLELIKNHVPSWEAQLKLEWAIMEYNCSFFRNGSLSNILDEFDAKLPLLITKISTVFSQLSSVKEKPHSTN